MRQTSLPCVYAQCVKVQYNYYSVVCIKKKNKKKSEFDIYNNAKVDKK